MSKVHTLYRQYRLDRRFILLSLTPILLLFLVFSVVPIVWGIMLGFYQYSALYQESPFIWLDNYKNLFQDEVFTQSFWNTVKFVGFAFPVNIVLTLLIALGINKVRSAIWRNTLRTMFFLPTIAPLSGSAIIWSTMYKNDGGLFNLTLERLGLDAVPWLSDPSMAMWSVVLMTLWADIGFNIVIFMAGLDSIPVQFYEAARLDGASRFVVFWKMTLPLLQRTTLFVTVMTLISYFQMFPQFQVMTNGEPQNSTNVLALNIYTNAFQYNSMGYASAMATVLLLIIMIITLVQIRLGRSKWEY
ncbi:sugar ABC transporter permease [Cohnella pontilimi]|uniref:Sugar ABC transporter permease n=1 Tax=Cohnella pontilimi TaxID=2564100 RepID=A0A4U0F1E6_9BACL|nr:sugar ABC transporter permease [Cohnella pontilimi]TJY38271.1 sugar ABC transporter permease [Cohnella pontilimi]